MLRWGSVSSTIRSANGSPPSAEGGEGGRRSRHKLLFASFGHEAGDGARLAAFQSFPPPFRVFTYKLVLYQPLAGRGGSVSRRDHNQQTGNRAHAAWGRKLEERTKPIPNCFPGGSAREAPFSERRPLSHHPKFQPLAGRGGSVSRRDHDQLTRNRTRLAGAYSQKKGAARTPATLREKRPLPQNLPTVASSGGGPGEGLLAEKPPPPEHHPRT